MTLPKWVANRSEDYKDSLPSSGKVRGLIFPGVDVPAIDPGKFALIRDYLGLTQTALAATLGKHRRTLDNWALHGVAEGEEAPLWDLFAQTQEVVKLIVDDKAATLKVHTSGYRVLDRGWIAPEAWFQHAAAMAFGFSPDFRIVR